MTTLVTILVVLALAAGGTGGTVYAAQGALPTDTLYGVKIFSEDAHLGFTTAPVDRATLLLELAQRRIQEIVALSTEDRPPLEPVATRLREEVDATLQIAASADDGMRAQLLARIQAQIENGLQGIAQAQARASNYAAPVLDQVRSMLQNRVQLCQTGLTDPQNFLNQLQGQTGDQHRLQEQTRTPQPGDQDQGRMRLQTGTPGMGDQDRLRDQTCTPQAGDQDQDRVQTGTPPRGPDPSRTPEPTKGVGPLPTRTQEGNGPGPNTSVTPEPIGTALGPGPQPTPASPGPQTTPGGPGPQSTQADPGPQPTQSDPGPHSTHGGPGPQPTVKPGGRP